MEGHRTHCQPQRIAIAAANSKSNSLELNTAGSTMNSAHWSPAALELLMYTEQRTNLKGIELQ